MENVRPKKRPKKRPSTDVYEYSKGVTEYQKTPCKTRCNKYL